MKISCFGSRVSCSFRKALRAAATSGRSCSAACTLFFKGQVDVVEEPRNPRLAHLHLFFRQANLKLCKRTIRLFRYKLLNPICMWLKRPTVAFARAEIPHGILRGQSNATPINLYEAIAVGTALGLNQ